MKIYVAGPYTAPTVEGCLENTVRAMDAYNELILKGHEPFCPHFSHFADQRAKELGIDIPYQEWMRQDEVWLRECEAFLYLAPSRGADVEKAVAQEMGMPIYTATEDIPDAGSS
jgi:hypothetical protein